MPPEAMIEAAMRDVPRTMADMENTCEFYAPGPAPGQKIVLHHRLVRELIEKQRHGKAASEWAIHRLVEREMLTARHGHTDRPSVRSRDGIWHVGNVVEVQELKYSLIESTARTWEWWHVSEHEQPGNRSLPAPMQQFQPDRVLDRARQRRQLLDRLQRIQEQLGARRTHVVGALRCFEASISGAAACCQDQVIPPERREVLANALLNVCQAVREGNSVGESS
jgi:hypothetical protein